jgi:UDP-glucuronate 4-epimerase
MGTILVTGAAGFIGFHTVQALLARGETVLGIDNLNDYYDPKLKQDRLAILDEQPGFSFRKLDLADRTGIASLFEEFGFERVVHLGAQAGVRYSITNPQVYVEANLIGFMNILEGCRHAKSAHLVYASSSSVYGSNTKMPFSTNDNVDHPVSLYAATKKANELLAHSYSHLYRLPTTGLRFFTVYGPWGRPDMALFLFTKAILAGDPIKVFNHGKMQRDFTYVDDIVEGVVRTLDHVPAANPDWPGEAVDPSGSFAPYKVYNIGNNQPVELLHLIQVIEKAIGKEAIMDLQPMQAGDVLATYADVDDLTEAVGFKPSTSVEDGVQQFVDWYRGYYGV